MANTHILFKADTLGEFRKFTEFLTDAIPFRPTQSLNLDIDCRKGSSIEFTTPCDPNLAQLIFDLYNEVDCRIEHGGDSSGHLDYVRGKLVKIKDMASIGVFPA